MLKSGRAPILVNHLDPAAAAKLASRIRAYWHSLGYSQVECWSALPETSKRLPAELLDHARRDVRSNLRGGLPANVTATELRRRLERA